MRSPVSQRSRRAPPKRHFSPLDSNKSVWEIKNSTWEFSPFEMSNPIKVRGKLTGVPVFHLVLFHAVRAGESPSCWKSTRHFPTALSNL